MKEAYNPLDFLKKHVSEIILDSIKSSFSITDIEPKIERPPKLEFGDLSTPIVFQLVKKIFKNKKEQKEKLEEVAEIIASRLSKDSFLIERVEVVGGYINMFLNYPKYAEIVSNTVLELDTKYGSVDIGNGEKIIVEHTSANPVHPLHIGTIRNAILGDTLARMYEFVGYDVNKRFYVDDMGRQVAYLVYAIQKLGWTPRGKIDHWLGAVYSCINTIIEVGRGLGKLEELKGEFINLLDESSRIINYINSANSDMFKVELESIKVKLKQLITTDWINLVNDVSRLISSIIEQESVKENYPKLVDINRKLKEIINELEKLLEWLQVESELKSRWGDIYTKLLEKVSGEDVEEKVSNLMVRYERGDESIKKEFRKICEAALNGFKESLDTLGIKFDGYDWESDVLWSGLVDKVIDNIEKNGWLIREKDTKASYVNIRKALLEMDQIRDIFGVNEKVIKKIMDKGREEELPPNLTLTRSDGTTLYPTRDLAYSVYKFEKFGAKKVFNVIGVDQALTQKQLKASLLLAGYNDISKNLIHVAYELVILPGKKLSARRGRYVTFDEIFLETYKRSYVEVSKRNPNASEEEKRKIAKSVAVGAIRYAMLSITPSKVIQFDWSRVLDFEQNSGPFLQYAYTRAVSILRRANWEVPRNVNFELLDKDIEKQLIWKIGEFPTIVLSAVEQLRPDIVTEYANKLAMMFNSFYQRYRVLQAETDELKKARLLLVDIYRRTLRNALNILGIPILEKM